MHQEASIVDQRKPVLYAGSWISTMFVNSAPCSVIRDLWKKHVLCQKRPVLYASSWVGAMFCQRVLLKRHMLCQQRPTSCASSWVTAILCRKRHIIEIYIVSKETCIVCRFVGQRHVLLQENYAIYCKHAWAVVRVQCLALRAPCAQFSRSAY